MGGVMDGCITSEGSSWPF